MRILATVCCLIVRVVLLGITLMRKGKPRAMQLHQVIIASLVLGYKLLVPPDGLAEKETPLVPIPIKYGVHVQCAAKVCTGLKLRRQVLLAVHNVPKANTVTFQRLDPTTNAKIAHPVGSV